LANDTPPRPDPHGYGLTRAVTRCILCGERPYRYPGRLCGPCYREANGGQRVELAPLVLDLPPVVVAPVVAPAPKPRSPGVGKVRNDQLVYRRKELGLPGATPAEVDAAWAARPVVRAVRLCQWADCDRRHEKHGCCRRHAHRLAIMDAVGTAPAEWPAMWEAREQELSELAAWNGAAHRGLPRKGPRPVLSLAEWRAMVKGRA